MYDKFKKAKSHAFGTGGGPKQSGSFWDQQIGHQTSLWTGVQGLGGALDSLHGGVPDNQSSSPESKSL